MVLETLWICGLFFLYAGGPVPGVNEAHYLAKAKHYWNSAWCPGDLFLGSADAHLVFYWTVGWLTRFLPLPAVAWLGRVAAWGLLAWAWQRLSWSIRSQRYLSILTAAWFVTLSDRFHLAGEWVVGGVEAKVFAYAFVLLGLRSLVLRRWTRVWLWFGIASAFHVLVGGWAVVAGAIAWIGDTRRPPLRTMFLPLIGGLVLALPGIVPALRLTLGVAPETVRAANAIYVFDRLAHHLLFHRFSPTRILSFALIVFTWGAISWQLERAPRWKRLNLMVIGAVWISVAGALLDAILRPYPEMSAAVLRYYWFRLGDALVPLGVAMSIPLLLRVWTDWTDRPPNTTTTSDDRPGQAQRSSRSLAAPAGGAPRQIRTAPRWRPALNRAGWVLAFLIPSLFFIEVSWNRQRDFRPGAERQSRPARYLGPERATRQWRAWRLAGRWIAQNTPADARFLTPRNQQTFKWYAQRSEVASWKDVPQDAASLVRWWRIMTRIYPSSVAHYGLGVWSDQQLAAIARHYGASYIVIDRIRTRRDIGLTRVYPDRHVRDPWFVVYQVAP